MEEQFLLNEYAIDFTQEFKSELISPGAVFSLNDIVTNVGSEIKYLYFQEGSIQQVGGHQLKTIKLNDIRYYQVDLSYLSEDEKISKLKSLKFEFQKEFFHMTDTKLFSFFGLPEDIRPTHNPKMLISTLQKKQLINKFVISIEDKLSTGLNAYPAQSTLFNLRQFISEYNHFAEYENNLIISQEKRLKDFSKFFKYANNLLDGMSPKRPELLNKIMKQKPRNRFGLTAEANPHDLSPTNLPKSSFNSTAVARDHIKSTPLERSEKTYEQQLQFSSDFQDNSINIMLGAAVGDDTYKIALSDHIKPGIEIKPGELITHTPPYNPHAKFDLLLSNENTVFLALNTNTNQRLIFNIRNNVTDLFYMKNIIHSLRRTNGDYKCLILSSNQDILGFTNILKASIYGDLHPVAIDRNDIGHLLRIDTSNQPLRLLPKKHSMHAVKNYKSYSFYNVIEPPLKLELPVIH